MTAFHLPQTGPLSHCAKKQHVMVTIKSNCTGLKVLLTFGGCDAKTMLCLMSLILSMRAQVFNYLAYMLILACN